ncbi:hypothetical protein [Flavobacterium sp. LB3R33]|uniref:hypothetical protein n=1 Tax=Flavobacterium sp. LB3R33 TaxID=3401721 RepID=UPI003AAFA8E3
MKDIIFIHTKKIPLYLKLAMYQAISCMPDVRVHLITDRVFQSKRVTTYSIEDYMQSANDFKQKYVHRSSNPHDFELFCFQRWFILRDFVSKEKIGRSFLYLDSDVFLYSDFFQHLDLGNFKMTVTSGFWPQYSLFKDEESIIDFSNFISEYFSIKEKKDYLEEWWQTQFVQKRILGGVCDMTLLGLYNTNCLELFETKEGYFNTTVDAIKEDAVKLGLDIDQFNLSGFSYKNKQAAILDVKVHALHFQAGAKILAAKYYCGKYRWIVNCYGFFYLKKLSMKRKVKMIKAFFN